MATHHPKIEICQNEAYYNHRLGIWHLDLIPKIKIRYHLLGWSTTIPRMVTHHTMDGHLSSKIYQKELYYKLGI